MRERTYKKPGLSSFLRPFLLLVLAAPPTPLFYGSNCVRGMLSSSSPPPGEKVVPYRLPRPSMIDRRWKPGVELAPNCPRCDSSNTKFCYYNNYSLTQPRYFCKGCRRYWTKGGTLRNVPVGGGCRKNRRSKIVRHAVAHRQSSVPSRNPPDGSIRPDFMLDGPAGTGARGSGSSADGSRSDGTGIDLAVLYAKFSNKVSEFDQSSPATTATPIDRQFQVGNIDQLAFPCAIGGDFQSSIANVGDCSMPSLLPARGIQPGDVFPPSEAPDVGVGPMIGCGSQLLLDEGVPNDLFWSSCPSTLDSSWTWQPQPLQSTGLVPVLDEPSMPMNSTDLLNGNWNTFDIATFEHHATSCMYSPPLFSST